MVLKPVPPRVVKALRKAYSQRVKIPGAVPKDAASFFSRLRSADRRMPTTPGHRIFIDDWGYRVRQLKAKGTDGIVIKRCHGESPMMILKTLRRIVDQHNARFKDEPYLLKKPVGHPIGGPFIAMSKVGAPTFEEIASDSRGKTVEGVNFLDRLAKKEGIPYAEMEQKLYDAAMRLSINISEVRKKVEANPLYYHFTRGNVVLAGYEKGKFIFVPLIDTE